MTQILLGDYEDAIAYAYTLGTVIHLDQEDDPEDGEAKDDLTYRWTSRTLTPDPIVFVKPGPRSFSLKHIKPRGDRHLLFGKVPAAWAKWIDDQKGNQPQGAGAPASSAKLHIREFKTTEAEIKRSLRTAGFTSSAAAYAMAVNPGGLSSVRRYVEHTQALGLQAPITEETLIEIWPFIPAQGKVYKVSVSKLLQQIGKADSLLLINGISDSEAFMLLSALRKAFANQPQRLELVEMCFKGIRDKLYRPKAALYMLLHLQIPITCKSTKTTISVFNQPSRSYPLLGLESLAS